MKRPLAALIALAAAAPLAAQPQEQPSQEIVVTGDRDPEESVRAFVEAVTVETDDQIARFESPICPAAFGLPAGHSEVIVERIRLIAEHLEIPLAGRGCTPNVVVLVADRGGEVVRRLRRERPDMFAALELSDIRDVMRLDGPVRAWQLTELRGADGRRLDWIEVGRERRLRPSLSGVMPSLTQRPTRHDLSVAFILFDLDAVEGLTLLQIADHAAMRALARTEPAALPARRSILTLFRDRDAGGAPAEELTGWDAAYLRALYRTGNTVSAHQQRSSLARTMRQDIASTPQE